MVYFIQGEKTRLIKIGMVDSGLNAGRGLARRFVNLQGSSPDKLTCLAVIDTRVSDRAYHDMFDGRVHHEWFEPTAELLAFIAGLPKTRYTRMSLMHLGIPRIQFCFDVTKSP